MLSIQYVFFGLNVQITVMTEYCSVIILYIVGNGPKGS